MPTAWPRRVGNLPAERTTFIDRRRELIAVRRLLAQARLVTLTGVAGVGKTRLALRVAAQVGRSVLAGAWLVDLAHTRDGTLVPAVVLESLGILEGAGRDPLLALVEFLSQRALLLVLDNCEHLADACAKLARTLLDEVDSLLILATSRATLGVPGELVFQVQPLRLPPGPARPGWQRPARSGAAQYPAVALFTDRAAAAVPTFALTMENTAVIANICRKLDGLPLAIELAAVRLRALSAEQILSRLDDRIDVLDPGLRAGSDRQHSMRAALDWSYDLCTDAERAAWARLAVFAGGIDPEGAAAVCTEAGIERSAVAAVLNGLEDKCILLRIQRAGRVRFRLLETLRVYGLEKLRAAGAEEATRARHAAHFCRLAEQAARRWFGPDELTWLALLQDDHANLRVALTHLLDSPDPASGRAALRLGANLWFYWAGTPAVTEASHWLDRALERNPEPTPDRVKALWVAGYVAEVRYDIEGMTRRLAQARELATALDDREGLAWTIARTASLNLITGDNEQAIAHGGEAITRFRDLGEPDGAGAVLARIAVGSGRLFLGELDAGTRMLEEALAICQARGERTMRSIALASLARVAWVRGDLTTATGYVCDALRMRRFTPAPAAVALALEIRAWIAATAHDYRRAAALFGGMDNLGRTLGVHQARSVVMVEPHDDAEKATRRALGDDAYEAAFRYGAGLCVEELVGYALGEEMRRKTWAHPHAADAPPPLLTSREQQVARLVAEGLSNKDIAARLVISRRTAESHIEHLLHKLNFTSRTQIAAWAYEFLLTDSAE